MSQSHEHLGEQGCKEKQVPKAELHERLEDFDIIMRRIRPFIRRPKLGDPNFYPPWKSEIEAPFERRRKPEPDSSNGD